MIGLNQKSHTYARNILTNKQAIRLNLLKIACEVNIKNCKFERIHGNFQHVFNHQIIPVSGVNPQSVEWIETVEMICH